RPLRALHRAPRGGERVLRAERSGGPARALHGAAPPARRGRRGGARDGRGLRPCARVRPPAHRRRGHRHRPPHHAAHGRPVDPRGDPLPAAPARGARMRWELLVGLRYLRSRRHAWVLSLISLLSLAGVTIGVATLDIVLGVMTGLERDLRDKILGFNPHVVVMSYGGAVGTDGHALESVRRVPGVVAASPFIYGQ